MKNQILRFPEVVHITGLSRSSIYIYMKEGVFPKPIKIGKRAIGWLEEDIEKYLHALAVKYTIKKKMF